MPRRGDGPSQAGPSQRDDPAAVRVKPLERMTFWQAMMDRSCLLEPEAKELLSMICQADVSADEYAATVAELNTDISWSSYQLKTIIYPVDMKKYVGVINTISDEASKHGTRFSVAERDFFKAAMGRMVMKPYEGDEIGSLSEIELLNMDILQTQHTQADTEGHLVGGKKMTKGDKVETLRELIVQGWLNSKKDGYYCLGPRAFLELGDYMLHLDGLPEDTKLRWQECI